MAFDTHSLLGYSTVQGGGVVSSTTGTSIQLSSSSGFSSGANQNITVWPSGVDPTTSNAEIMRVTNNNTQNNTLTVTRAQEGSTALGNIAVGYQVANTITPKVLTDIESNLYQAYKFSVYRNAAANSGNNSFLLVTFDTKLYDTGSNYSTSTGEFTAPVAGFYHFSVGVNVATSTNTIVSLAKNSTTAEFVRLSEVLTAGTMTAGIDIQLAANDYVCILCYTPTGSALGVGSAPYLTYFTGYLISQT